jgi:transcriptional regulator with XRE-family HTH domain
MSEPEEHPSTQLEHEEQEEHEGLPPERAGVTDDLFAAAVREARERKKMSQGELARRMADRGFPYYQQTIRRIEDGRRKVSVGEAKALAQILETTIDQLTWPTQEASAAALLDMNITRAGQAYEEISRWTGTLLWALGQLETAAAEAKGMTFHEPRKMQVLLREAEAVMKFTPEGAVASMRAAHEAERQAALASLRAELESAASGKDGDERH